MKYKNIDVLLIINKFKWNENWGPSKGDRLPIKVYKDSGKKDYLNP